MSKTVQLTLRQAHAALWATNGAYKLLRDFLRHDNWDSEMTKQQKRMALSTDKEFKKIAKALQRAIEKAEGKKP